MGLFNALSVLALNDFEGNPAARQVVAMYFVERPCP
jgi:hypothetical protein